MPVACGDWAKALPNARWSAGIRGQGARNGNYKHGCYTAETVAARRWLRMKYAR